MCSRSGKLIGRRPPGCALTLQHRSRPGPVRGQSARPRPPAGSRVQRLPPAADGGGGGPRARTRGPVHRLDRLLFCTHTHMLISEHLAVPREPAGDGLVERGRGRAAGEREGGQQEREELSTGRGPRGGRPVPRRGLTMYLACSVGAKKSSILAGQVRGANAYSVSPTPGPAQGCERRHAREQHSRRSGGD